MMSVGHMLDHVPNHVLDHIIIGLVTTALQVSGERDSQLGKVGVTIKTSTSAST